jgi:hypothetical protein
MASAANETAFSRCTKNIQGRKQDAENNGKIICKTRKKNKGKQISANY